MTNATRRRLALGGALAATVSVCAIGSDAAAVTPRRVCGIAGFDDGSGYFGRGNCAIVNNDTAVHYVKYSIPTDNGISPVSAQTYVDGGSSGASQTCARLRVYEAATIKQTGGLYCTTGTGSPEQLSMAALTMSTYQSAVVNISLGAGARVYDCEVTR